MQGVQRGLRPYLPYTVTRPLTRVELHVHLDGSVRHETIYELSKAKNLSLPGDGSLQALKNFLVVKHGVSLAHFLGGFDTILRPLLGDLKALERIAYEIVEDSSQQGIAYFEARFCPHLLLPQNVINDLKESMKWVWDVTQAVIKGLEKGQAEFKTRGTLVITAIRGRPNHWFHQTLELVADHSFHGGRIVGVDIAGYADTSSEDQTMKTDTALTFCVDAARLGIGRTIHAGESGEGEMVAHAVDELLAMRIGHGYRITSHRPTYDRIRKEQIHLETCPWSSLLTASVSPTQLPHPIVQFFEDDFNVSINTDDPTITGSKLDDEYNLLRAWGLHEHHFVKANFNAARSCFLPANEKADLVQELSKTYGFTIAAPSK